MLSFAGAARRTRGLKHSIASHENNHRSHAHSLKMCTRGNLAQEVLFYLSLIAQRLHLHVAGGTAYAR
jgi:hypothetical protein